MCAGGDGSGEVGHGTRCERGRARIKTQKRRAEKIPPECGRHAGFREHSRGWKKERSD